MMSPFSPYHESNSPERVEVPSTESSPGDDQYAAAEAPQKLIYTLDSTVHMSQTYKSGLA